MSSRLHQLENSAPTDQEQMAPCTECGASLSRYVSKCPKCGHHAHRLSHAEIYEQREYRQKLWLVLTTVGIVVVALLYAWSMQVIS